MRRECPLGKELLLQVQVRRARRLSFGHRREAEQWAPSRQHGAGRGPAFLPVQASRLLSPAAAGAAWSSGKGRGRPGLWRREGPRRAAGRGGCKGENRSHFNLHVLLPDRARHPRSNTPPLVSSQVATLAFRVFIVLFVCFRGRGQLGGSWTCIPSVFSCSPHPASSSFGALTVLPSDGSKTCGVVGGGNERSPLHPAL